MFCLSWRTHAVLLTANPIISILVIRSMMPGGTVPLIRATGSTPLSCLSLTTQWQMMIRPRAIKGRAVGRPVQLFLLFASSRCNRSPGATLHLPSVPWWNRGNDDPQMLRRCRDTAAQLRTAPVQSKGLRLICEPVTTDATWRCCSVLPRADDQPDSRQN